MARRPQHSEYSSCQKFCPFCGRDIPSFLRKQSRETQDIWKSWVPAPRFRGDKLRANDEGVYALTYGVMAALTIPPSHCPLPLGERVFDTPSLDGRGKGEGDNHLKSQTPLS